MSPPLPHRYIKTYSLPHEYTETRNRNESPSPFKEMDKLAKRQQNRIDELKEFLRQQTARLDEVERELTREKKKRSLDKVELKRLRSKIDNQHCDNCKTTKYHRSPQVRVSSGRRELQQPREEKIVYIKDSYTREERNRHAPKYDKPYSSNRSNDKHYSSYRSNDKPYSSCRSNDRLPDRESSFGRYSSDPRLKKRRNNEHWKHGLGANRNCGFAMPEGSRVLKEGYEVRREKGVVGRLGKGVREIPAGLAAAAARERRRDARDRG